MTYPPLSISNDVAVRNRRLSIVLVLAVTAAACGGGDDGASSAATGTSGAAAFCEAWNAAMTSAMTSGDDSAFGEALADPPTEIAEEARIVREAGARREESPAAEAATSKILDWTELNCERGEPGASTRRVAPPITATFDGLTFCGTTAFPVSPPSDAAGMILYGEAGASDPYDGPMLGLFWDPADDGTHAGDGDPQPVTVRGRSGVAAPITVFQQTIVPELGTVIAWTEGDRDFGLYGREWPIDRAAELVEIANGIEEASGGFRFPADGLPEGYEEVFAGDPGVAWLVLAPSPLYSLQFQGEDGLLVVNGLQMSEDEFEAFRFLTIGVDEGEIAGRRGLVGNAWHADGPVVATWRESDGLVVRIVGFGVPLPTAEEVADQSRELADGEWAALVEAEDSCTRGYGR